MILKNTTIRIWEIDGKFVVAPSIEDAIIIYRRYKEGEDILSVKAVYSTCKDFDALIQEEKE